MAIRHKRKNSTGYAWTSGDLVEGQVGLNIADGTLHFQKSDLTTVKLEPNRASTGANSDITSLTGITGGISTADYVTFDTVNVQTEGVGKLIWDDGNGTLQFGLKGGNVNLQIGQEQVIRIYNGTGSTLTDGQVVYITGSQGNRLTVALASASSESTSSNTIGVVTESIANGTEGFITTSGIVNGLNTLGLTEGASIWLSTTAGQYTTIKPTAPNHAVLIGYVVRAHATTGSIFVHVQNGYELEELHNVLITTPTSGQVLKYNGTNWVNGTDSASPAGSNTQIQFNSSGSFGASADFKWDDTNKVLTIGGQWVETHLGSQSVAGNPILAFHSSGATTSDARIYSDVGSGANDGDLYFNSGYEYHTGSVVYLKTTNNVFAQLRSNAGYDRYFRYTSGNSDRWYVGVDGTAESGSNVGSNFYIKRFSDAGAVLGTALTIDRSTGNATFSGSISATVIDGGSY